MLLEYIRKFTLDFPPCSGSWADMDEIEYNTTRESTKCKMPQHLSTSKMDICSSSETFGKRAEDLKIGLHQEYRQNEDKVETERDYWEAGAKDLDHIYEAHNAVSPERRILVEKPISRHTPLSRLVMIKSAVQNAKFDFIYSPNSENCQKEWLYAAAEQERRISMCIFDVAF